jgi:N6-L-threonylcarbamoyladenine synthase
VIVLGIETSCDETAAAVVEDGRRIRSNVVASQVELHRRFGGVVPELASRKHVERFLPVLDEALEQAGLPLTQVEGIAVTYGPGLVGALTVGVAAAKGLALSLDRPLVGINHLEGHIYAAFLADPDIEFPALALIVSGAHTDLVSMRTHGSYEVLGRTRDDAAGEAFDKIARAMGLPYPGGPELDKLGQDGDPKGVPLPLPMPDGSLDFSFSGLKTAALKAWREGEPSDDPWVVDLAASVQHVVAKVLVSKSMAAADRVHPRTIVLVGGVAANSVLRGMMERACNGRGYRLVIPPPILCTDNAAMIATAGDYRFGRDLRDGLALSAYSDLPLSPWTEPSPGRMA